MKLVNIGLGNYVAAGHIISVEGPDSASMKLLIKEAKRVSRLVDATYGRKTRAVLVTDSGYVVLSPIQSDTVNRRRLG